MPQSFHLSWRVCGAWEFNMKIIKRRVSMIFHSENYGCQIGTGACRNLCPVQIHPGGFSAALESLILCGFHPQKSGTGTEIHISQEGAGNLKITTLQKYITAILTSVLLFAIFSYHRQPERIPQDDIRLFHLMNGLAASGQRVIQLLQNDPDGSGSHFFIRQIDDTQ